jgi:hypothetical protein
MHFLKAFIFFLILQPFLLHAQEEKQWMKNQLNTLTNASMNGRGYVDKGGEKAAHYINNLFKNIGLQSFYEASDYLQEYSFPVNTFPNKVFLRLQQKKLKPGVDFIVHAASQGYSCRNKKIVAVKLKNLKDSIEWHKLKKTFKQDKAYFLQDADTVVKYVFNSSRKFAKDLPQGLFLIPQHGKLTWTVATETIPATIFYVEDTVLPRRIKKVSVKLDEQFIPNFKNSNVIGYVKGTAFPDSFLVFSAHYDHLGKMGKHTMFPGANDNASGTSLMLYMAKYFAEHPQKYSIAFMAFSGEEAGLLGSKFYVNNPLFPLKKIRFVVNLDMAGEAINGITVVNATEQKKAFQTLKRINDDFGFLSKITERGQTQNSDHFHFSEKGVPAIFIYANGTKPYYHDVFDQAKEVTFDGVDGMIGLLKEFVKQLQR